MNHCTQIAIRVGSDGINHIFRVGLQLGEGVRKGFLCGEAISVEVLVEFHTHHGEPLLHFALGGQQVVVGGAVGIGREGGRHLGLQHLVDADSHLGVVDRCVAVVLLHALCLKGADDGLGAGDGPKVLDDDGAVGGDKDDGGLGRNVVHA